MARGLKAGSPNTKIIACEPDNAQILASGIPQSRDENGNHNESHPNFRPHLMQGWSPDFIPKLTEKTISDNLIDGYVAIDGNHSIHCSKDLAQQEGLFVGITAGATFSAALKVAETAPAGSNILCMLPDTGERYLTTTLFEDVATEMTAEELAIAQTTQGFRFDVTATAAIEEVIPKAEITAVSELNEILKNKETPIIMFALEWCEFCWSVRKALAEYGIEFKSVDIDSVAYQKGNRGGKLRVALRNKTTWNTFPQLFIKGEFIGGCTDLFDGIKDGSIFESLDKHGIKRNKTVQTDPYTFLPSWLHPRNQTA